MDQEEITTKKCSKCQEIKPVSEFYFRKERNNYSSFCKKCHHKLTTNWRQTHEDYFKNWHNLNTQNIKEYREKHQIKHKQYMKQWHKEHYQGEKIKRNHDYMNNPEKFRNRCKKWKKDHPDYIKERWHNDSLFRNKQISRSRIRSSLKSIKKTDKTIKLIGSNQKDHNFYISCLFHNNMTWETQGIGHSKWQIHHICPLEFFDITDPVEQKQAYHYTNTKPLWYKDHVEEHRKINERMKQYENNGRPISS